ncbi:MAG TPA: CocE/NonD family hydrolase [Candidatus Nanoarchaeia archaeon]|nr:CocE/NonD family hydrolase [Candidatus Nanoarchaeia archaeon]
MSSIETAPEPEVARPETPVSTPPPTKIVLKRFGNEEIEVIYRKARTPIAPSEANESADISAFGFCPELNTQTYVAAPGILCEQDVPVKLRDGTTIYTDVFRPIGATDIPAIVNWSYFGKRQQENHEWQAMGVPPGTVSRMAKFEAADPAYWCHQGYAVINPDPRGVCRSEGDIDMFGSQDGRDGYDFIEWLAVQHWCNGKVGMFGNSGVAMVQYRIAAEQPPHLACIAPWEGTGDLYREALYQGGVPALRFTSFIGNSLVGSGYIDDTVAMAVKYPFMNGYWEDKIPKWEKIKIPAYFTGSWSHMHLRGAFEGFRKIRSPKKWMRVHRDFEWPDTYTPANLEDLKRFYDRYLKDIRNGWELTPRVRMDVMDAYDCDFQVARGEKEFPLARTQYKKLYVNAGNNALSYEPATTESSTSYDAQTGRTTFTYRFNETTEISGYMWLRLWVEAQGNSEMDLFINIRKLGEDGEWLATDVLGEPHPGGWGWMRVSRRELDPKLTTKYQPVQAHKGEQKLKPGEIVPVDVELYPHSRIWHKGQQLEIQITGYYAREGWFEPFSWETDNKGSHVIHSGGKHDSYLQIPVIPPRYKAGEYVYR